MVGPLLGEHVDERLGLGLPYSWTHPYDPIWYGCTIRTCPHTFYTLYLYYPLYGFSFTPSAV
jgi:hypothetical protein